MHNFAQVPIDSRMAQHLRRLVETDDTLGAVVAVQKLWRDLTMPEIVKEKMNLQECFARCVLRDHHKTHLASITFTNESNALTDTDHRRRILRYPHGLQFGRVNVSLADHMNTCSGIYHKLSFLRFMVDAAGITHSSESE